MFAHIEARHGWTRFGHDGLQGPSPCLQGLVSPMSLRHLPPLKVFPHCGNRAATAPVLAAPWPPMKEFPFQVVSANVWASSVDSFTHSSGEPAGRTGPTELVPSLSGPCGPEEERVGSQDTIFYSCYQKKKRVILGGGKEPRSTTQSWRKHKDVMTKSYPDTPRFLEMKPKFWTSG